MAVAAEKIQDAQLDQEIFATQAEQLVEVVPDMEFDRLTRLRAARFIGACALSNQTEYVGVETNLRVQPIESLYDAIHLAAEGNRVAYKMVETNVRTDVIERTIKAGHVIKVDLQVDESGKIQQHGQSMESIQANSLRHASDSWQMRERTEAEVTNAFRIAELYQAGTLQEYSFVVFSPAADNMTEQEMTEAGFFTETMSCAIQVTTAQGGRLTTESAFVAGVRHAGAARHDVDTIIATGQKLGVDLRGKTTTGLLGTPWLVPNRLIPNGVINLVEIFDGPNGTFFGEDRPVEDYLEFLEKCKERQAMLQPKVETITQELLNEASLIHDKLTAVQRLHKLSGKHMIEQAAFDHSINPRVFGSVAAVHIVQARVRFELGDTNGGLEQLYEAEANDRSNSCPTGMKNTTELENYGSKEKSDDDGDCEYISKECPICHEKNVKTKVKKISQTKTIISGSCGCAVIK